MPFYFIFLRSLAHHHKRLCFLNDNWHVFSLLSRSFILADIVVDDLDDVGRFKQSSASAANGIALLLQLFTIFIRLQYYLRRAPESFRFRRLRALFVLWMLSDT